MTVTWQPITLDTDGVDDEAVLVLRNGRLAAILTCLGDIHGDAAGQWFVEMIFGSSPSVGRTNHIFATPAEFASLIDHETSATDPCL